MINIAAIADILNLTRATELQKGSWVSLSSDLPGYDLYQALLPRLSKKSSFDIAFTIAIDGADTAEYSSVNKPLQVSIPTINKRVSVRLAKVRKATAYSRDEQELQGGSEEELVDVVMQRKAERLDQPLLSFMEHKLCDAPASSTMTEQELYGLKYWFPRDSGATALELNGGGNPTGFSGGAAGLTVADVPRWGHAVCGFTEVSDTDLLDKLHEFFIRVNYHVPEGAKTIGSAVADRITLCQHPVFRTWARLQTAANDDLKSDIGVWRNAISFMSQPVKVLHAISEPGSPQTPSDHGLLYNLDLNTLQLVMHSTLNFGLEQNQDPNVPGTVKVWREGYAQLLCTNRERNLVANTTNSDLYTGA